MHQGKVSHIAQKGSVKMDKKALANVGETVIWRDDINNKKISLERKLQGNLSNANLSSFNQGTGAETLLMASLWRRGYEAFKMPVDYGIDVLSIKREDITSDKHTLYLFQVKSKRIQDLERKVIEESYQKGKANRYHYDFSLTFGWNTLALMDSNRDPQKKYAIVIFLIDETGIFSNRGKGYMADPEDNTLLYFWINEDNLKNIIPKKLEVAGQSNLGYNNYKIWFRLYSEVVLPQKRVTQRSQQIFILNGEEEKYLGRNNVDDYSEPTNSITNHFSISNFFDMSEAL